MIVKLNRIMLRLVLIFFSVLIYVSAVNCSERPEIGKYAKVFSSGSSNLIVTMVRIGPVESKEFLIQFDGIDSEYDGKIIKHYYGGSSHGKDKYYNKVMDSEGNYYTVSIDDYGATVDLPGMEEQFIHFDKYASGQVNTQHFLTKFLYKNDDEPVIDRKGRPEVGSYASVYNSRNSNLVVAILRIGPKENREFLVEFNGVDSKYDGKIIKHFYGGKSHGKEKYYNKVMGKDGEKYYACQIMDGSVIIDIPGIDETELYYSRGESNRVIPEHFLTAYMEQQNM